jgi:pyridoxal phosphate enzyme (YggS family)
MECGHGPGYTAGGIVLRDRLTQVEERIERAVARAGRRRSEITLIAVTKKFSPQVILDAYALGLRDFGENYVQEFEAKHAAVAQLADARFHLIGHLQGNKARVAASLFQSIHTVDSEKLARRLHDSLDASRPPLGVMIEVKLSPEESKVGAPPEALPALVEAIAAFPRLRLTGLMTMPPWSEDQEQTRPYFRKLADLAKSAGLPQLSMGMSHDFEAAIEEGATHIRVGTALFGPRPKPGTVP